MDNQDEFKQPYLPPKVTAVSFKVENGFVSQQDSPLFLGGSEGNDSYDSYQSDFWSSSEGSRSFGANDSYSSADWSW